MRDSGVGVPSIDGTLQESGFQDFGSRHVHLSFDAANLRLGGFWSMSFRDFAAMLGPQKPFRTSVWA